MAQKAIPPQYRQGDVLLVAVSQIPPQSKEVEREEGRVILAHGEVTGHAHAICDESAVKLTDGIEEYLRLAEEGALTHEEHATLHVPAGDYRLVHQREYHPAEFSRKVRD